METDVCVIGGGPAGATVARRLATLGHRVCLVERAAHPNHKVGVALPPNIIPLLDAFGLRERVEGASFVRTTTVLNRWADDVERVESTHDAPGFVVDRARFDRILLAAAEEAGVTVLQPARAARPHANADGSWEIEVGSDAGPLSVRAAFVVDATGKGSATAGQRERYSPPTVALNAYWRGVKADPSAVMIEAGPDEWFWGATLPDGTFNAMVFLDPSRCRRAASGHNLESLYHSLLAGSSLLRRCLSGTLVGGVSGRDASSYADARPVGPRSIKVGEANFSIDPLSSQGVQAAITSGLQAAVVVNTILKSEACAAAAQFYRDRQKEAVARHARFAARYYSEARLRHAGQFWQKRAAAEPPRGRGRRRAAGPPPAALRLGLSGEAALVATPCVTGDFVRSVPALVHPAIERPVAYFGEVEVSRLLGLLPQGGTTAEIVRAWAPCVPPREGFELVSRLYQAGVLVNAARD